MPDRALEQAAAALRETWALTDARKKAEVAVSAYLGALRRELPEHAIDAMMESGGRSSTNTTRELCERWAQALLAALTGEGRDG